MNQHALLCRDILYSSQGHLQGLQRIDRVESGAYTPAYDFLAVGIQYQRQIAEAVMCLVRPYRYIGDVADPQLVYCCRNKVLDKVRVGLQTVCRVCRTGLTDALTHFQVVFVYQVLKAVSAHRGITFEVTLVHVPQFHAAYARILLANITDVGQGKLLLGCLPEYYVLVSLEICLL